MLVKLADGEWLDAVLIARVQLATKNVSPQVNTKLYSLEIKLHDGSSIRSQFPASTTETAALSRLDEFAQQVNMVRGAPPYIKSRDEASMLRDVFTDRL